MRVRGQPFGQPLQALEPAVVGGYFPPPVRRVPRQRRMGTRPLERSTVADRIAQEVARRYLEPIVEPVLSDPAATDPANLRSRPCARLEALNRPAQGCEPARRPQHPLRLSGLPVTSPKDNVGEEGRTHLRARFQPAASPKALTRISREIRVGATSPHRQVPERAGPDVQPVHPRLDHLLQPLLQDAAASQALKADRCLCHPVGTSQVHADAPPEPKRQGDGSTGYTVPTQYSLLIGRYIMATARHREPCDQRGSRTVLGARR